VFNHYCKYHYYNGFLWHRDPLKSVPSVGDLNPPLTHGFLGPPESKRYLNWFSCFRIADGCDQQTDTQTYTQQQAASLHSMHVLWPNTHPPTRLTALFLGLPGWAGTRKVKPIWILLKQETVSGTTLFFYRPDALPAAQPTASKH